VKSEATTPVESVDVREKSEPSSRAKNRKKQARTDGMVKSLMLSFRGTDAIAKTVGLP
jgi:hypothetical protein